jgi:ADP-heptose:LPS heptosyltransferase
VLVTVDTAAAHVAGGLDKPVALLLPHAADWRWMQAPEHTAWYPHTRLFRQARAGDWRVPVERVRRSLEERRRDLA